MKAGTQRLWWELPPAVYRHFWGRFGLLFVFGGSLGLLWWSVDRLPSLEKQFQEHTTRVSQLENEVEQLAMDWDALEAEKIAGQFKQAQEQLFVLPQELTVWQDEMQRQPNLFGLQVGTRLDPAQPMAVANKTLSLLPVTLEVQPLADDESTNAPYKRLLDFAQALTRQSKRVDLLEINVKGNSNSISQARVAVQLWAEDKTPK